MGHSYSNVLVHVVFSTKNRAKIIPRDRQEDLWRYMVGIGKKIKVNVIAIGGIPDHIHMLIAPPGTIGHSTAIQKIKENSSKWMGPKFELQEGFGAFSVSDSRREDVIAYIRDQEGHHTKRNFEEEFIALLKDITSITIRGTFSDNADSASSLRALDPYLSASQDFVLGFHLSCLRHFFISGTTGCQHWAKVGTVRGSEWVFGPRLKKPQHQTQHLSSAEADSGSHGRRRQISSRNAGTDGTHSHFYSHNRKTFRLARAKKSIF